MDIVIILAIIAAALLFVAWLGLRIQPAPFPSFGKQTAPLKTVPLPQDLPAPVERFFRATYGESQDSGVIIPVIHSAALSGRGRMSPLGFSMPMRFRFLYDQNHDYRAFIEATFFGLRFMQGDESYVDGVGIARMPTGIDQGPWFDESMILRVWCEILTWFPAALLTDERVHWEAVDEHTALLVVPFNGQGKKIVVRFNADTGLVDYFEVVKHRTKDVRMLWINAIWFDKGKPWIFMDIEEKLFNIETRATIRG